MTDRFDDLARSLADPAAVERRGMLGRAFAALGVGAVAAVAGADRAGAAPKPPAGTSCPPGLTACGSVCRDITGHNSHCGACGNACANDSVCRNGTCVTVACTCDPVCPAGQTWCNGACRDLQGDVANCGVCGTACPPVANGTAICSGGTCGSVCSDGFADCDGNAATGCETNTATSTSHCGACGHTCAAGETCSNGQCMCTPQSAAQTCFQQGRNCGQARNNCGQLVNCGSCSAPMTCGGDGVCRLP